jgi:hypothetical protein
MQDLGHWVTNIEVPENPYGFIYIITNKVNGRMYVGKKQILTKLKRKPLKGRVNKRISIKETDWKTYTGSSKELNLDIEKYGIQNFLFEIIKFCDNKSQMAYFEAKEQFDREVLIKEEYYNGIINLRLGKIKF